jgi:hypothetical protein
VLRAVSVRLEDARERPQPVGFGDGAVQNFDDSSPMARNRREDGPDLNAEMIALPTCGKIWISWPDCCAIVCDSDVPDASCVMMSLIWNDRFCSSYGFRPNSDGRPRESIPPIAAFARFNWFSTPFIATACSVAVILSRFSQSSSFAASSAAFCSATASGLSSAFSAAIAAASSFVTCSASFIRLQPVRRSPRSAPL